MGVTERLASLAVSGSRVLLVGEPGGDLLRVRAEAVLSARGWGLASAPADSDVLMVCGRPGAELRTAIDRVWAQMPAPRVRIAVESDPELEGALDRARSELLDVVAQRRDAAARPGISEAISESEEEAPHRAHGMTAASQDHHRADDGEPAMDMDMDMDMSGPAGIPLASGAEGDRDGLEMDVLHLRLGPILPDWPAGLVVDCTISGDVIVEADAHLLPTDGDRTVAAPASHGEGMEVAVLRLDRAARLLRIAGWSAQAGRVDRVRNEVLTGAGAGHAARIAGVRRRVGRSLVLRWSLAGVAGPGGVDVRARLLTMLDEAGDVLRGDLMLPLEPVSPSVIAAQLSGRSLAAARLIVAAGSITQIAPQVLRA